MRINLFPMRMFVSASLLLCLATTAYGQTEDQAHDAAALARKAQNPVANMSSLPFQFNWNFDAGPLEKDQQILNIQPVYPIKLSDDWNLITRTIMPLISQPAYSASQSRKNGLGDINFTAFFSPSKVGSSGWIWGAGPAIIMNTATNDRLGQGAWSVGPSAVFLKMTGAWVAGGVVSNVWSVSEESGRANVNQLLFQPFINYNFPDKPGRYLTYSPIMTANWEADSGQKWTVPVGLGIGQVMKLGKQPVNLQVAAFYNAVRPDNASKWQLRAQFVLMFPK